MGLINCPSCGQRQSEENVECINCGTPLNNLIGTQNPVKNMKDGEICCPHCGHIQSRTIERCQACGEGMRTKLKYWKQNVGGTFLGVGVVILGILFAMHIEVSLGVAISLIGIVIVVLGCICVRNSFKNAGLLLDSVNAERLYLSLIHI